MVPERMVRPMRLRATSTSLTRTFTTSPAFTTSFSMRSFIAATSRKTFGLMERG